MKTTQHTAEQIIKILDRAATGEQSVTVVCREHGIAETTFTEWAPGWRKAYGRMSVNVAQRFFMASLVPHVRRRLIHQRVRAGLLQRHRPAFGPGLLPRCLVELRPDGSYTTVMTDLFGWCQGIAERLT